MNATPLLLTLPWIAPVVVAAIRARRSTSLDEYRSTAPSDAPFVSVIVPARNERRNIERCVRSILASNYPHFEIIVVDDRSNDGTGDIARAIAREVRARSDVRVVESPALPAGWFGKQWACATGARAARGELLLFTDADTQHAPDLLPRSVNALRGRDVDLLTVAGHQEMGTFWERVVQPQMFATISLRFGGTEDVSHATRPADVIANGQFILVRRDTYEAMDGHHLVRHRVAEDLSMAQEWVRAGKRIALLLAVHQLSTRMYTSLGEVVEGWRKNIYAGGRYAMRGGTMGMAFFPVAVLGLPLVSLAPVAALFLALTGVLGASWLVWSATIVVVALAYWAAVYRFLNQRMWNALLYPLGLILFLYIAAGAVVRGRRVRWKDRDYVIDR